MISEKILNFGFYAILQGRNELEPGWKGSPGYSKEQHLLARSELSEVQLCSHVGFATHGFLGNVAGLFHIRYRIDLKALIFLHNLILDCLTSDKIYS